MSGYDFRRETDLVGASFRGAKLLGADFRGCDLRSADFRAADCVGALFDGARFGRSRGRESTVQVAGFMISAVISFMAVTALAYEFYFMTLPGLQHEWSYWASVVSTMTALAAIARYGTSQRNLVTAIFAVAVAFVSIVVGADGNFEGVGVGLVVILVGGAAIILAGAGGNAAAIVGVLVGAVGMAAFSLARVTEASAPRILAPYALSIILAEVVFLGLYGHLAIRVREQDSRFRQMVGLQAKIASLGSTRFDGANLSEASLRATCMSGVRVSNANLTRTNWKEASGLEDCIHEDAVLSQPTVRGLVSSRNGRGLSLVRADLHDVDLSSVDLRDANLKEANLTGALLTDAVLTGACIEAWNVDKTTDLRGVKCEYIFLRDQPDDKASRQRRPADPERNFGPQEFEKLYTKVREEMEILLRKGLSPAAMRQAFHELQEQHPGVTITKFEDRGTHVLAGLRLPPALDEAAVERTLLSSFEAAYLVVNAEKDLLLEHNQVLREMALAAAAANVIVYEGAKKVEDKSIHVGGSLNIAGQVGSLSGDVRNLTQTLTQARGEAAALAAAMEKLATAIIESKALAAAEKHEATQLLTTLAKAGESAKEPGWVAVGGKAVERLSEMLRKATDLTQLLEAVAKAWEVICRAQGA